MRQVVNYLKAEHAKFRYATGPDEAAALTCIYGIRRAFLRAKFGLPFWSWFRYIRRSFRRNPWRNRVGGPPSECQEQQVTGLTSTISDSYRAATARTCANEEAACYWNDRVSVDRIWLQSTVAATFESGPSSSSTKSAGTATAAGYFGTWTSARHPSPCYCQWHSYSWSSGTGIRTDLRSRCESRARIWWGQHLRPFARCCLSDSQCR